ncbi:MAG: iron ABC transporter permease [Lagierella massiliensis]|nr:iron ABC transporter permease [Lagierella massiliensis]
MNKKHFNKLSNRRPMKIMVLLLVILFLTIFISILLGRYGVFFSETIKILFSTFLPIKQTWTENMAISVINIRLPRILMACLVGGCLAVAGTAYQSVFQNPMAAPDILGASSGACFGAALAILLGMPGALVTLFAFISSLITIVLVYIIGIRTRGNQIVNILLAGIMIGSIFSAGTSFVKLVADPSNQLPAITYWLMGSLSGTRMADVKFVVVPMIIGILPIYIIRWKMNILTLGEEEAKSLGVNIKRLRLVVILGATFITAASVSVSGMIGWVGLVIPHMSRRLVGNDNRYLVPTSMLFGAIFLLIVDDVSRNLLPTEIPIGILTAFIGAPFFLYLMTGKGERR